jgi:phosphate-selective porin
VNARAIAQYVSVLWNLTGEDFSKTYNRGAWGSIKPNEEFMKDYGGVVGTGKGAWQLAYRYSTYKVSVDQTASTSLLSGTMSSYALTDGSTGLSSGASRVQNSPSAQTHTLGLNWILSANARVMFNYSETKFNSAVEYLDTGSNSSTTSAEKIFAVRTQVNF